MGKLVTIKHELVARSVNDINEMLKPLSRDILLFSTNIADTYKLKDMIPLLSLKVNDRLDFKRTNSKYDPDQLMIVDSNGDIVGYVPETDWTIFSRLMEAGKKLFAVVKSISLASRIPHIEIDIYLKDF